jgi:hypothetical protein
MPDNKKVRKGSDLLRALQGLVQESKQDVADLSAEEVRRELAARGINTLQLSLRLKAYLASIRRVREPAGPAFMCWMQEFPDVPQRCRAARAAIDRSRSSASPEDVSDLKRQVIAAANQLNETDPQAAGPYLIRLLGVGFQKPGEAELRKMLDELTRRKRSAPGEVPSGKTPSGHIPSDKAPSDKTSSRKS